MLQNFDRLKVFYNVFSLQSIAAAAALLHVTQPAVSQTIQKLEAELGVALFTRQHKRIIPTSYGDQLFAVMQPFMKELDGFCKNLAYSNDDPFGELRVGAPPEFGKAYLPRITAEFRRKYPNTNFYLKFGTPETILKQMEEGQLDLALIDVFPTHSALLAEKSHNTLHFQPVFKERIILACSKEYYASNIKENTFDELASQDFIEYKRNSRTIESWFKHHFHTQKIRHRTVLIVNDHLSVISAIAHGAGLGVIASHLVDKEIQEGNIIAIAPSQKEMINDISLVELQNKIPTLAEKVFKQYLVDQIKLVADMVV